MAIDKITIKGAREHNLKNIDLEIPKGKLVVLTGISGSGKSSLAFDTLYAEGQRRYVESLSAYARQFLGVMDKPDVDLIEGLSPAISIDQKGVSHNPRSTVGTTTEIYDYLRLLFARVGHPHCPICGREISKMSIEQIVQQITKMEEGKGKKGLRVMILAPVVKDRKGEYTQLFEDFRKKGFSKVRVDGHVRDLTDDLVLIKTNKHTVDLVVDRLVLDKESIKEPQFTSRLSQSVETALKMGEGSVVVSEVLDASLEFPQNPKKMNDHLFSERFACPIDNIALSEVEPRLLSFNSPHGACPTCSGLGTLLEIDETTILNPILSIAEGGILPWAKLATNETWFSRLIEAVGKEYGFDLNTRLGQLSPEAREILLKGSKDKEFKVEGRNRQGKWTHFYSAYQGLVPYLKERYETSESDYVKGEIEKYMVKEICPKCHGARLKDEALSITIDGLNIAELTTMSIGEALVWDKKIGENKLILSERETIIATPILKEIVSRLQFLMDVGLDYLTLDRASMTLAGGESQRIRLASQIGSGLSGVLYVLDEPSIGLHQRDNTRLIETLKKLRDLGNTVVVNEHDSETMENADLLIEIGPGAGEHGGYIVEMGTIDQIKNSKNSLTGQYLSGKKQVKVNGELKRDPVDMGNLKLVGASEHNLKNITVNFPLGKFVAITGVSGSGKSTLIHDILYKALAQKINKSREKAGNYKDLEGLEYIDKVVLVDQSPIGRTPRSNPATYTGAFTFIRDLFSQSPEAKIRGYGPGRFSFNVKGGRCEVCEGEGQLKIEMQFLPDVYVTCEACNGARYNREALEIHFKEKNISEVLNMTVEESLTFFENIPNIKNKLQVLNDVGLALFAIWIIFNIASDFFKKVKFSKLFYDAKFLLVILLSSILATFINPFGVDIYTEVLKHARNPLQQYIIEWDSLESYSLVWWYLYIWLFLIGISSLLIVYKKKIPEYIFYIFFSFLLITLSFFIRRYVWVTFLVSIPLIKYLLDFFKPKTYVKNSLIYALIILGTIYISFIKIPNLFESGWNWETYCVYRGCSPESAQFLVDYKDYSNLFSDYNWGGWLIWNYPDIKPLIDGRMPFWEDETGYSAFRNYVEIERNIKDIDQTKYDLVYIQPQKPVTNRLLELTAEGKWEIIYSDEQALIFKREE